MRCVGAGVLVTSWVSRTMSKVNVFKLDFRWVRGLMEHGRSGVYCREGWGGEVYIMWTRDWVIRDWLDSVMCVTLYTQWCVTLYTEIRFSYLENLYNSEWWMNQVRKILCIIMSFICSNIFCCQYLGVIRSLSHFSKSVCSSK